MWWQASEVNALLKSLTSSYNVEYKQRFVFSARETLLSLCSPPITALVSNPPYLFSQDMKSLEPEISRWILRFPPFMLFILHCYAQSKYYEEGHIAL